MPKPDQNSDPKMLIDIHSACMDDVHPRPSINDSAVSNEESAALDVWLPRSSPPISPISMSDLKSSWSPLRPMEGLMSTWATLSKATKEDDLFKQYMACGATSNYPTKILDYISAMPFTAPAVGYALQPTFDVVFVPFSPGDRTAEFRNLLFHQNSAYNPLRLDATTL